MLYTIAVATGCALVGVVAGSIVQRTAKFLYPTDWMSIAVMAAIAADIILELAPWSPVWYAPFMLGFFVGYLLVGRTKYDMAMDVRIDTKSVVMRPWVLYDHDGVTCIQKQKNRDLLRRQVFGVHNELVDQEGAPIQIEADWRSDAKYPLFPKFEKSLIVLEDCDDVFRVEHLWWRFGIRIPSTVARLGFASTASKLSLLRSADILEQQQTMIVRLTSEVHRLTTAQGPKLMEMAIRINNRAQQTTPENRMFELMMDEDSGNSRKKAPAVPAQNEEVEDGDSDEDAAEAEQRA